MDGFTGRFEHCGFSSLAGLSDASESAAIPHGVCGRKKQRRSPPRLELGILPGKASADLDGDATSV